METRLRRTFALSGKRKTIALVIALTTSTAGCVFYPKLEHYESECETPARRFVLEVELSETPCLEPGSGSGEEFAACLTIMAGLSAASALVSGSIVVVGNTALWLQKEAECMGRPAS